MITLKESLIPICDRSQFNAGNLTGEILYNYTGERLGYVVKSYGVTIARWIIGSEPQLDPSAYKYSQTTSKHANIVRKAWGI